jgi:hypothetical protein
MTPRIPKELSTRFIDWSPLVIVGNSRPEILLKTKRTRTKTKMKRTAPTNRQ